MKSQDTSQMYNMNKLSFLERLNLGKYIAEAQIFARLHEIYGERIQPSDDLSDIKEKIDCYLDDSLCSIKTRTKTEYSGDDLLSCLSQPYTNKDNLLKGRDSKKYAKIFCRNVAGDRIRVFDGAFVRDINLRLVETYKNMETDILKRPNQSVTPDGFEYEDWKCQLRSWRDADNRQLKVCSFIPEEYARFHNAMEIIES